MTGARFAAIVSRLPGVAGTVDIATAMPSGASPPVDFATLGFVLGDTMRPERIYTGGELSDLLDAGSESSVEEALDRLGAVSINAMRVVVPAVAMTIGIFGARMFDAADGAVLRRLFPYLQAAVRTASRVSHERLHAAMAADLARRTNLGWYLLDRTGAVLDHWAATPTVARCVRVLPGIHGDRLALADRAAEAALSALLDSFGRDAPPQPRALWVSQDPPMHLRIAPVPSEWVFDPRRPAALATLHGAGRLLPGVETLLVDLFGLLPSEARLAAALAGGDRLDEAADRLGLTVETARNYSKKIFAKTDTRGQGDLIRLILSRGLAEIERA